MEGVRAKGMELKKEFLNAEFTTTAVEHSCRTRTCWIGRLLLQYICTSGYCSSLNVWARSLVFCQKVCSPNKLHKTSSSVQRVLTTGYLEQELFLQKHFPDIGGIICCDLRDQRIKNNQMKINMVHIYRALFKTVRM